MVRTCNSCGTALTENNWWPSSQKRQYYKCNTCERDMQRAYRERRPYVIMNKALKQYGITHEDYERMYLQQGGVCAICEESETYAGRTNLSVDHCHSTGKIRGLLCASCNMALGKFKDSKELLEKAVRYLNAN